MILKVGMSIVGTVLFNRYLGSRYKEDKMAEAIYSNYIEGMDDNGNKYFKIQNETPKPFFQNTIQCLNKKDQTPETE